MTSTNESSIETPKSSSSNVETVMFNNNGGDFTNYSSTPITIYKLNGRNYIQWSQSFMFHVRSKEKEDYLTENITKLDEKDAGYRICQRDNSQVMSWLVNSMEPHIGENFLLYETTAEIWEAAKDTYSHKDNTPKLVTIEGVLHDLRQGDLFMPEYYNKLHQSWQQLDAFEKYSWDTTADLKQYKKIIENKRAYKFCLGLNSSLDAIRGRIFSTKPLSSLREAFFEVRREKSRRHLMLGMEKSTAGGESSALAAQNQQQSRKGGRPWCEHCRRPGHTKETCWKLYGKPADWKPKTAAEKEIRGNIAGSSKQLANFSKEELDGLRRLLQSQQNPPIVGSGSIAQKGNFLKALTVKQEHYKPWIIDSGTSDHMIGDRRVFYTYFPCNETLIVRIAYGSLAKVEGIGSVVVSRDITLKFFLYVPNLDCNQLSINKITQDLNCIANFSPYFCEF
uniref:Retrovirus-related Pol polyprotein from transposon TNT 1-94-like beta-barrel domain-containing protein n=1 Tax=Nelumbo nucifera TaxID=4432 RepID=A0A822Y2B6_NELNU|nr:TPA_asm: hypothetical protein HUJ06_028055 [Nelumbo nucifera]